MTIGNIEHRDSRESVYDWLTVFNTPDSMLHAIGSSKVVKRSLSDDVRNQEIDVVLTSVG